MSRRMGYRIKFFSRTAGQNEDGEVVDTVKNVVCECWANVSSATIKDFRAVSGIEAGKDTKVFTIRYHRHPLFDNSMYIEFDGMEYKITDIEIDYEYKKHILVKATSAE